MNSRFLLSLACAAGLAVAAPVTLHARGDDAARNAIIGGIAGAIIGEHNDHRAAEGAAIGVAAGLLLTALTDDSDCDRRVVYHSAPRYHADTVVVSRPYCPPPRVVVVPPRPHHHSRNVVVVHPPAHHHGCRTVIVNRDHDRRHDRYERRHDRWDRRDDRRDARHELRDDRRDDRRDRYARD